MDLVCFLSLLRRWRWVFALGVLIGGASDYAVGARAMGAILNKLSESSHGHHAYSYYPFSPERSTNGSLSDSAGRVQPPSSPSLRIYLSSVGLVVGQSDRQGRVLQRR